MLRGLLRKKLNFKKRRRIRYPREPWVSKDLADAVDALELSYSPKLVSPSLYAKLARQCCRERAFSFGVRVHRHMDATKYLGDTFVANLLIRMYAKCGNLEWGKQVFETMHKRTVQSWNVFLGMFAVNHMPREVYVNFRRMLTQHAVPDAVSFELAIRACGQLRDLASGVEFHSRIIDMGISQDHKLQAAIIFMYSECDRPDTALQVFADVRFKEAPVWNAAISAFRRQGQHDRALEFFWAMLVEGKRSDKTTYSLALEVCVILRMNRHANEIAEMIVSQGLDRARSRSLQLALVKIYAENHHFDRAKEMLLQMPLCVTAGWHYCLERYARDGFFAQALDLYNTMRARPGTDPDTRVFVLALGSCCGPDHLSQGRAIHARAVATKVYHSSRLIAAIIRMYSRCGSFDDAKRVFDRSSSKNLRAWNAMLEAYLLYGRSKECLELFETIERERIRTNEQTFGIVFTACSSKDYLTRGKEIVDSLLKSSSSLSSKTMSDILNMYALGGDSKNAMLAFDKMTLRDGLSWRALALAFENAGRVDKVPRILQVMELEGFHEP